MDDFVVAKVPPPQYTEKDYRLFAFYQIIRDIRDGKKTPYDLDSCVQDILTEFSLEWLLILEALELAMATQQKKLEEACRHQLSRKIYSVDATQCIREGLAIAHETRI